MKRNQGTTFYVHLPVAGKAQFSDQLQYLVACCMAMSVVHRLEPVQVDEHHCQSPCVALGLNQARSQPVVEQGQVRQAGDGVVERAAAGAGAYLERQSIPRSECALPRRRGAIDSVSSLESGALQPGARSAVPARSVAARTFAQPESARTIQLNIALEMRRGVVRKKRLAERRAGPP